jgi:hypothetical protein
MEKSIITISEDVINSVVKPISLFLNDVMDGAVFTHVVRPKTSSEYKIEKKDGKNIYPIFTFASNKGGTYKFTLYDLKNFGFDTVKFANYFIPQADKKCRLTDTFTVNSCEPLLVDGEKVYPFFCYTGYETYLESRKAQADGEYPTEAMIADIKATEIKAGSIDRYYRVIDIDKPIFYYPE